MPEFTAVRNGETVMVQEKTTDDYKPQKPGTCCSDWSLDP